MNFNDFASQIHPNPDPNFESIIFTKNVVKSPNIIVGDYTYNHAFTKEDALDFEKNWVLYPHPEHKLIIGKFCALAYGSKFIMNGSSHKTDGFSAYPFASLGKEWQEKMPLSLFPMKKDTVLENDVWVGAFSTIMPGIHIGNGAIIATGSVVVKDVPAYSIVGGNPATIIRYRFEPEIIKRLEKICWWDWDIEKIHRNCPAIYNADIDTLEKSL